MANDYVYPEEMVFLPTYQDFMEHKELFDLEKTYWLMDSGLKNIAFATTNKGVCVGDFITEKHFVKPVLVLKTSEAALGATINYKFLSWTKIKEKKIRKDLILHYFLCTSVIGEVIYDENTNIYKGSYIESFIEDKLDVKNVEIYSPKMKKKQEIQEKKQALKKEKLDKQLKKEEEKKRIKEEKALEKKRKKEEKEDD